MSAHFRTDPALAARFDALVRRNPIHAVRLVIGTDLGIGPDDVPTPALDGLAAIPRSDIVTYRAFEESHAAELANERTAVAMTRNVDGARRIESGLSAAAVARERAAFVEKRTREIGEERAARQLAKDRVQAEKEAALKFPSSPTSHDSGPEAA